MNRSSTGDYMLRGIKCRAFHGGENMGVIVGHSEDGNSMQKFDIGAFTFGVPSIYDLQSLLRLGSAWRWELAALKIQPLRQKMDELINSLFIGGEDASRSIFEDSLQRLLTRQLRAADDNVTVLCASAEEKLKEIQEQWSSVLLRASANDEVLHKNIEGMLDDKKDLFFQGILRPKLEKLLQLLGMCDQEERSHVHACLNHSHSDAHMIEMIGDVEQTRSLQQLKQYLQDLNLQDYNPRQLLLQIQPDLLEEGMLEMLQLPMNSDALRNIVHKNRLVDVVLLLKYQEKMVQDASRQSSQPVFMFCTGGYMVCEELCGQMQRLPTVVGLAAESVLSGGRLTGGISGAVEEVTAEQKEGQNVHSGP